MCFNLYTKYISYVYSSCREAVIAQRIWLVRTNITLFSIYIVEIDAILVKRFLN